jgi:uncharacterized damage-inducible protein DinB
MPTEPESTLVEFILYNQWANRQLLAACLPLSEAQLAAAIPGGYGSILKTFHHVLEAEADYLARITGSSPRPSFKWDDRSDLGVMPAFAEQVGAAFLDMLRSVPPTQNVHEAEGNQTLDYQARHLFMQLINHGIEHRTNITTYLANNGLPVPDLDNWAYMFAHRDRFDVKEGGTAGG